MRTLPCPQVKSLVSIRAASPDMSELTSWSQGNVAVPQKKTCHFNSHLIKFQSDTPLSCNVVLTQTTSPLPEINDYRKKERNNPE